MKCPYCNKKYPDDYQFCPITGKKIESLIACSNPQCKEFRKKILPQDSLFCPQCGKKIGDSNSISQGIDLFPLFGVTLGKTRICDMPDVLGSEEVIGGIRGKLKHGVYVFQGKKDLFIEGMSITKYGARTIPPKWHKVLGLSFGFSADDCKTILDNKGFVLKDTQCEDDGEISDYYYTTPDSKYLINVSFDEDEIYSLFVILFKCPNCDSSEVKISFDQYHDVILTCESCGKEWGAVE